MAVFPSKEWCEEAIRLVNADEETAAAGKGWDADFGAVVEAEPGKLARSFTVHLVPKDGRVHTFKVLQDPDDLDELEPVYRVRAPYSTWKGLLLGTIDPIEAILRRRIFVEGDVQPLIERMKYKGIAERLLRQIQTTFPDEHPR